MTTGGWYRYCAIDVPLTFIKQQERGPTLKLVTKQEDGV